MVSSHNMEDSFPQVFVFPFAPNPWLECYYCPNSTDKRESGSLKQGAELVFLFQPHNSHNFLYAQVSLTAVYRYHRENLLTGPLMRKPSPCLSMGID